MKLVSALLCSNYTYYLKIIVNDLQKTDGMQRHCRSSRGDWGWLSHILLMYELLIFKNTFNINSYIK